MVQTKDPQLEKYERFEQMIRAPKGFRQKGIRFLLRLVYVAIWPLANIYPISIGADSGRLFKLRDNKKYRQAVEFGCKCLKEYIPRLEKKARFSFPVREMTWFFFDCVIECALYDPRPEDEGIFCEFAESLGLNEIGDAPSEAFCSLARLAWVLGKPEEAWSWIDRAVGENSSNAYAHYLKGWFGVLLDKGNPVASLFEAVSQNPELLRSMRKDNTLAGYPDFMMALEARVKEAGILVV